MRFHSREDSILATAFCVPSFATVYKQGVRSNQCRTVFYHPGTGLQPSFGFSPSLTFSFPFSSDSRNRIKTTAVVHSEVLCHNPHKNLACRGIFIYFRSSVFPPIRVSDFLDIITVITYIKYS
jgi:hypothetical protein